MAFNRPTIQELSDRIKGDLEASLALTTPILKKSVFWVLSKVFAGAVHLLFGFLDFISRQVFPDTAEAEFLDRWAAFWGVERKPSTFAAHDLEITGAEGAVLPGGSIFQSVSEIEYVTQADGTITSGVATVRAIAGTSGSIGNLETGAELEIVSPVAGIEPTATVLASNPTDGVDEELDEELRGRLLDRIQNPPQGGAVTDYEIWAKSVPGVTRAWVYPTWLGPGTVGVTFVMDNSDPIIPDAGTIAAVLDYIDTVKPATANVSVFAPSERTVDFTISLTPSTAETRAAVTEELIDLIFREATPGNTLYLSQIREAVSNASGEVDSTVSVPTGNVAIAENEIGVLGTITWV